MRATLTYYYMDSVVDANTLRALFLAFSFFRIISDSTYYILHIKKSHTEENGHEHDQRAVRV